ncbi:MAG: hypothetical protein M1819_000837 [Sarea resinae]|nr:MAG: hypothetical protein M1819_000837 [Sarea resinae]
MATTTVVELQKESKVTKEKKDKKDKKAKKEKKEKKGKKDSDSAAKETVISAREESPTFDVAQDPNIDATEDSLPDAPEAIAEDLRSPISKKRKRDDRTLEEIEVDISKPEPPSKKALRKAKKAKTDPTSDAKPGAEKKEPDGEGTENNKSAKRSDFGIWIGNLPFTAAKADLRKFLTDNANITDEMITRIHMPAPAEAASAASRQRTKPQNKGFAYVDFSDATALQEALDLSETLMTGRRVLIKNSKSFEGRPEKPKEASTTTLVSNGGKPPSRRIFVGNLGFETTRADLEEHFAPCGEVTDVHIATFEDSGKCKGFAWVEFKDLESGEAAVRGFTKIPEKSDDDSEDEETDEIKEGDGGKKTKKAPKMRKWWVNKMRGRPLRMEFAEDKSVRYKKRYGKDGTARRGDGDHPAAESNGAGISGGDVANGADTAASTSTDAPRKAAYAKGPATRKVDARTIKPGAALAGAERMTGAIVESKGKKTTF